MVLMFITGSINLALSVCFGFAVIYTFAVLQDVWGLIALAANFLFVIVALLFVFVGWDPFRDDRRITNYDC